MIRPALSNTANLGLLSLAVPAQNFAQRRQDADRALQYQMASADQAKLDRVQLQQEIAVQRQKAEAIRNLSLLAPDQNRVNMVADELESAIVDKVRKQYGNNVKKYLEEQADADYEEMVRAIRNSDAYKQGNTNKVNMAQYLEDQKSGRMPMLIGGRNVTDVLSDFQTGRVARFDYSGGYTPPKDYAKRIQDSYGDDRFTKQAADPARVILELQQDGLTLKQAMDYYQQAGLAVNPIYHKSEDEYAKSVMMEESALRKARINKLNAPPKQPADKANFDAIEAFKQIPTQDVQRNFGGKPTAASVSNTLSKDEADLAFNLANGRYDAKTGYHLVDPGQTIMTADGTQRITGINHVTNPRVVVMKNPNDPNRDQVFLQVDGAMTETEAEKNTALRSTSGGGTRSVESFFSNDEQIGGSALINNSPWWKMGAGSDPNGFKYQVKDLLIPIGDKTALGQMLLNKRANIAKKNFDPTGYEENAAAALMEDY